jgi:hypothetical protein
MEEWKVLTRIPHYEVSNLGRVRSLKFNKQKLLKACQTNQGYLLYCLADNQKRYTSYAHRLVAEVFLGPPVTEHLVVNHKNKNRQDNSVENLEWVSVGDNLFHKNSPTLYEINQICSKLNDDQLEAVLKFAKSKLK